MRFLQKTKDGGKESTVDAYFLIEIKGLFSIALLKFNKGSRANYHSHAFDALTWFIKGDMEEHRLYDNGTVTVKKYKQSIFPKITKRNNMHKVFANKTSWCFTIRGRWEKEWQEINPTTNMRETLTHGRKVVHTEPVKKKWCGKCTKCSCPK